MMLGCGELQPVRVRLPQNVTRATIDPLTHARSMLTAWSQPPSWQPPFQSSGMLVRFPHSQAIPTSIPIGFTASDWQRHRQCHGRRNHESN
jgi:hypothetical protein